LVLRVRLFGKVGVPELAAQFLADDLSIFDRGHQVIGCPPEVLADGFAVIGDGGDFYG
jgi:hypothetical protein